MKTLRRVRIEKLVYGGYGLARVDGKVVFVPFTAPGDQALVSITQEKKHFSMGRLVDLEQAGEGRRRPCCPYYQDCGGCQLQHLEYSQQVLQKKNILEENLSRILPETDLPEIHFLTGPELHYRRSVQFQAGDTGRPELGFYRAKSRQIVDISSCPVVAQPLDAAYGRLRSSDLLAEFPKDRIGGVKAIYSQRRDCTHFAVLPRGTRRVLEPRAMAYLRDDGSEIKPLILTVSHEAESIEETVSDWTFWIHPLSFFQSNRFLTPQLVHLVEEAASTCPSSELALELFSGNGLFTLALSHMFRRILAVEQDRRASIDAVRNAAVNDIDNIRWVHSEVDPWVSEDAQQRLEVDYLLVDPPRDGLSKHVSRWVLKRKPKRITYVSCSPPTLARDLKRWVNNGPYRIERVAGIDLFPQTFHVEAVVTLALM